MIIGRATWVDEAGWICHWDASHGRLPLQLLHASDCVLLVQGRLPPGVSLASLLKESGGVQRAEAEESALKLESSADVWKEIGNLSAKERRDQLYKEEREEGEAMQRREEEAAERAGRGGIVSGPRIEDYVREDVVDVFDAIAGELR